jgi:cell division protein FtsZ
MTLFDVDEAASRVREEVDADANMVVGATFDDALGGRLKVSIVATGLRQPAEVIFLAEHMA